MSWFYLLIAGFFEMSGVAMINKVNRDRNLTSLLLMLLLMAASFLFLKIAMAELSMGIAYAVWTGIGTVGSTILGMFFYQEPKDKKRVFFIGMIIIATIGLRSVS
ncbi:DMT family transporter [Thalassobacillus devorans]|uniref:DMT family transporter n=1 Tax=Thalassobacillus devorans TaxID=279813 RepID=UPI0004903AFE|nr:multidrug efflux SMR transporter [Thalassobacillus devorans]